MKNSSSEPTSSNFQKHTSGNPIQRRLIARFHQRVLELTTSTGATQAIEVGCGEGFALRYLARNAPSIQFSGFDLDPLAVAVARHLAPDMAVEVADIRDLPCEDESTDLVVCLEVLEHLTEPRLALAEIHRVTRRHAIFSVPNEPWFRLANLARGKNFSRWGDDEGHLQRWTRSEFAGLLAEYFNVRTVESRFPWAIALVERRG